MTTEKAEKIHELVRHFEMAEGLPSSQQECCNMTARLAYAAGAFRPTTEAQFLAAANGMAQGLFGDAWLRAGEHQRAQWLEMCERALRTEA